MLSGIKAIDDDAYDAYKHAMMNPGGNVQVAKALMKQIDRLASLLEDGGRKLQDTQSKKQKIEQSFDEETNKINVDVAGAGIVPLERSSWV